MVPIPESWKVASIALAFSPEQIDGRGRDLTTTGGSYADALFEMDPAAGAGIGSGSGREAHAHPLRCRVHTRIRCRACSCDCPGCRIVENIDVIRAIMLTNKGLHLFISDIRMNSGEEEPDHGRRWRHDADRGSWCARTRALDKRRMHELVVLAYVSIVRAHCG